MIADDVFQLRQLAQTLEHLGGPFAQLIEIAVLQRVLKLRARRSAPNANVLACLQVEVDARHLRELRPKAVQNLVGDRLARWLVLQLDEHRPRVRRRAAARADERYRVRHVGIGLDDRADDLLPLAHRRKRNVLGTLGEPRNHSRILLREKALRDDDEEKDGEPYRGERDEQRHGSMPENPIQAPGIHMQHAVEDALRAVVELLRDAALARRWLLGMCSQQTRAHHGCQRQRDDGRDPDGNREGDGELAKEPPDDSAHEQDGDEHRQKRDGDRDDRETDLLGAIERGLHRRLAELDVAGDVLGDDDGVVDDEPRRDREGHQRQVVEAVTQEVHHAERAKERKRNRDARNCRGAQRSQEHEDHRNDQNDADDERVLDVVHRGANGLGPVERDVHPNGRRDGLHELGKERPHALVGLDDVRPWLPANDEKNRPLAVHPGRGAVVLDTIDDVGDVAQPNDVSIAGVDDQRSKLRCTEELVVGRDRGGLGGAGDVTLRLIDGRLRENASDVFEPEPNAGKRARIDFHPHRGLLPSPHEHLAYPGYPRNFLSQDGVGVVEDLRQRYGRRRERQDHDR